MLVLLCTPLPWPELSHKSSTVPPNLHIYRVIKYKVNKRKALREKRNIIKIEEMITGKREREREAIPSRRIMIKEMTREAPHITAVSRYEFITSLIAYFMTCSAVTLVPSTSFIFDSSSFATSLPVPWSASSSPKLTRSSNPGIHLPNREVLKHYIR